MTDLVAPGLAPAPAQPVVLSDTQLASKPRTSLSDKSNIPSAGQSHMHIHSEVRSLILS